MASSDHGNLLSLILEITTGLLNVIENNKFFSVLEKIRSEPVIKYGKVVARTKETENEIENSRYSPINSIEILSEAKELISCLENKITPKICLSIDF